jgi:hypothetical protein
LFGRRRCHLAGRFVQDRLFAQTQHDEEQRAHRGEADREENQNAQQFPGEIFKARDRFRQDRVGGAIFDILREEASGCQHGQ